MRWSYFRRSVSGLNAEKGVFLLAALWLFAMGVRLIQAPEMPDWGPPRTSGCARDVSGAGLNDVMPYPEGGSDPFVDLEELAEPPQPPEPPEPTEAPEPPEPTEAPRPRERPGAQEPPEPEEPHIAVSPGLSPRFVGTLSVEDSGTYTFIAEGDEYVSIAPGEDRSGRYRLIKRSATHIVVEDRSSRRFQIPLP